MVRSSRIERSRNDGRRPRDVRPSSRCGVRRATAERCDPAASHGGSWCTAGTDDSGRRPVPSTTASACSHGRSVREERLLLRRPAGAVRGVAGPVDARRAAVVPAARPGCRPRSPWTCTAAAPPIPHRSPPARRPAPTASPATRRTRRGPVEASPPRRAPGHQRGGDPPHREVDPGGQPVPARVEEVQMHGRYPAGRPRSRPVSRLLPAPEYPSTVTSRTRPHRGPLPDERDEPGHVERPPATAPPPTSTARRRTPPRAARRCRRPGARLSGTVPDRPRRRPYPGANGRDGRAVRRSSQPGARSYILACSAPCRCTNICADVRAHRARFAARVDDDGSRTPESGGVRAHAQRPRRNAPVDVPAAAVGVVMNRGW